MNEREVAVVIAAAAAAAAEKNKKKRSIAAVIVIALGDVSHSPSCNKKRGKKTNIIK